MRLLAIVCLMVSLGNIAQYNIDINQQTKIVASVISAEACSEGTLVMFGVGSTIRNRMIQNQMSAYEVVTAKNQYYGYTNKNRNKIFQDTRCSIPAMFIAENINKLPDMVNGAIYFRFKNEQKKHWHKNLTQTINTCEFYK